MHYSASGLSQLPLEGVEYHCPPMDFGVLYFQMFLRTPRTLRSEESR